MPSLDLVERLENMKSDEHSASYFAEVYCYLVRLESERSELKAFVVS